MNTTNVLQTYTLSYLNQDMKDELYLSLARKEATRIIKARRFRLASEQIEKHLKEKLITMGS